ncbi:hypothetical protein PPGU19_004840 [Paraburkholderia sp. PGU19]|nr:hypothetical protein PPGU19_004840 [Paraburkholderia sp. PGU19]
MGRFHSHGVCGLSRESIRSLVATATFMAAGFVTVFLQRKADVAVLAALLVRAGFCPGPALVALGAGYPKAVGFLAAMVAGMTVFELLERAKSAMEQA